MSWSGLMEQPVNEASLSTVDAWDQLHDTLAAKLDSLKQCLEPSVKEKKLANKEAPSAEKEDPDAAAVEAKEDAGATEAATSD
eukprot:2418728-Amphidinium_carterae.5